jgi:CRP-like cAMP-binding protein
MKDVFGEISFFSKKPRSVTVKAKNFTEVLYLTRENFEEVCREYPEDAITYDEIQRLTATKKNDYSCLKTICYIC